MPEAFVCSEVFVYTLQLYIDREEFVWHSAAVRARAGPPGQEVTWNQTKYKYKKQSRSAPSRDCAFLMAEPGGAKYLSIRSICALYSACEVFVCFFFNLKGLSVFCLRSICGPP